MLTTGQLQKSHRHWVPHNHCPSDVPLWPNFSPQGSHPRTLPRFSLICFIDFRTRRKLSQQSRGHKSPWHGQLARTSLELFQRDTAFILILIVINRLVFWLFFFFWSTENNFSSFIRILNSWSLREDRLQNSFQPKRFVASQLVTTDQILPSTCCNCENNSFLGLWIDSFPSDSNLKVTLPKSLPEKPHFLFMLCRPQVAMKMNYSSATYSVYLQKFYESKNAKQIWSTYGLNLLLSAAEVIRLFCWCYVLKRSIFSPHLSDYHFIFCPYFSS